MTVQSPVSNLRDVLSQVKETAATYQSQFQNNEAATRLALIDPVLTALGWNLANPLMVGVENTAQSVRADYVLYDSAASPKIVFEAKALGAKITGGTSQLFATAARIQANQKKTGFITDGLKWEHYYDKSALRSHARIWACNIASDDLQAIAAHLIKHLDAAEFWPPEEDTTAPEILQLQQDYAALKQDYVALEKRVTALVGVGTGGGKLVPPLKNWEDLDTLQGDMTNTVPSELLLPDGTKQVTRSWRQALLIACETALNSNPQLLLPFPDKAGRSINLINQVQVPRSVPLTTSGGVTVFIHLNYTATGCVANIKHVLAQVPAAKQTVKPAVVYIRN